MSKKKKKEVVRERPPERSSSVMWMTTRNPYVGDGDRCNYCGATVTVRGVCPRADQHEDHGGF